MSLEACVQKSLEERVVANHRTRDPVRSLPALMISGSFRKGWEGPDLPGPCQEGRQAVKDSEKCGEVAPSPTPMTWPGIGTRPFLVS